jgi:mono/diheme cytochrome c family protein
MQKMSVALLAGAGALIVAMAASARSEREPAGPDRATLARGEYLVTVGGCNDCHTPLKIGPNGPEPDMTRMLSGHPEQFVITAPARLTGQEWMIASAPTNTAHSGPWGVSFTANLTPDQNTGLGIWTEDMFKKALRTGRHMGVSRPILPPMPWFNYGKMSDEDIHAVYAYLRSIPAIHNRVPDPLPPAEATATN